MRTIGLGICAALALSGCGQLGGAGPRLAAELPVGIEGFPWWNDTVFYEIFVRSFYDSNGDGIGDLNGITAKLDYLNDGDPSTNSDLGVTGIWLMPIHPSPSYHGYAVTDYYAVNPQYGTTDDFKRLLSEAHRRGVRVIIDLVLNHTSDQHPWFRAAQDPSSPYRDWYVWSANEPDYPGPWGQTVWHAGEVGYFYGLFSANMPDLNYANPDVTGQIQEIVGFWIQEVGVDGFRLDAARHMIEVGRVQQNTTETHEWFRSFRAYYQSLDPAALTVGEVWEISPIAATYAQGDQLDLVFDFSLAEAFIASARVGRANEVRRILEADTGTFRPGQFGAFLSNHDQNRVSSQLAGDPDKARVAASLLLTSPGVPFMYYGEEIGMSGIKPDEDIRRPMQWSDETGAGFTTGRPWRPLDPNYPSINVDRSSADRDSLWTHYRDLIDLRNQHSALRVGTFFTVEPGAPYLFGSLRVSQGEAVLVLLNLGADRVSEYALALPESLLQPGQYRVRTLIGGRARSDLRVDPQGGFAGYRPLPSVPPHSTNIWQLTLDR